MLMKSSDEDDGVESSVDNKYKDSLGTGAGDSVEMDIVEGGAGANAGDSAGDCVGEGGSERVWTLLEDSVD